MSLSSNSNRRSPLKTCIKTALAAILVVVAAFAIGYGSGIGIQNTANNKNEALVSSAKNQALVSSAKNQALQEVPSSTVGSKSSKYSKSAKDDRGFPAVFASTFTPPLTLSSSSTDMNGEVATLKEDIYIGTVEGPAVVQSSIKTRIQLLTLMDSFCVGCLTGDETVAGLGKVSLKILAYQGCTSADTCKSVKPVVLAPGLVSINGISKEVTLFDIFFGENGTVLNTGLESTNMAMFVLMDSGPHFLQAHFELETEAEVSGEVFSDDDDGLDDDGPGRRLPQSDVNVFVDNYIIMVTRTA